MDKKKATIINAFFSHTNLAVDEFLKNTDKDIPQSFRNGFEPKRKDQNDVEKSPIDSKEIPTTTVVTEETLNKNYEKQTTTNMDKIENFSLQSLNFHEENFLTSKEKLGGGEEAGSQDNESMIPNISETNETQQTSDSASESTEENLLLIENKGKLHKESDKIASIKNSLEITLDDMELVYRKYMLYAEATTKNSHILIAKYAVAHGRYGLALAELEKIIATKSTTSDYLATEKAIIEVLDKLGWKHLADEERKALLLKHPKSYRLF